MEQSPHAVVGLISAIRKGNLETVKNLIDSHGISDSKTFSNGYFLLCEALKYGHVEVAKLLLSKGCEVDDKSKNITDTPLHLAAAFGIAAEEIVKMILDKSANIDVKNKFGLTPLHIAVDTRKIKIVELLLKHGADVNIADNHGTYPLHIAVGKRNLELTELLLKHDANIDCVFSATWGEGYAPLHIAVEHCNEKITTLLLSKGANVDIKTKDRKTPLHIAAKMANPNIFNILLKYGAQINSQDEAGKTVLHFAVQSECIEIVETLLQHEADVNSYDMLGRTALHFTVIGPETGKKVEIAKLLLTNGADVNFRTINGESTLHIAAQNGCTKIVKVLLQHNANVNYRTKCNMTPLHYSTQIGNNEIVAMLLEKEADVNAKEKFGCTPLHIATNIGLRDQFGRSAFHIDSQQERDKIVQNLLNYGSDINVKSQSGKTPLDHAMSHVCDPYLDTCLCEIISELLKNHIIKMKIAGLYVSQEHLLSVTDKYIERFGREYSNRHDGNIHTFEDDCKKEIANMKDEKIHYAHIPLYDILAKSTNSLAGYMKNENVIDVLKSNEYKSQYPIYASMIECQFRKAMKRRKLFEQFPFSVIQSFSNDLAKLPFDCVEKIINYLCDEELMIFINALKPDTFDEDLIISDGKLEKKI